MVTLEFPLNYKRNAKEAVAFLYLDGHDRGLRAEPLAARFAVGRQANAGRHARG
jgi:hypothetical protein